VVSTQCTDCHLPRDERTKGGEEEESGEKKGRGGGGGGGGTLLWLEGFLGFEPRMVMFKVKCGLSRGEN